MRMHLFFISTIVLMVAAIIYFSMMLQDQNFLYFHGEKENARDFLTEFRETYRPLAELNLAAMYGGQGQFHNLHPIFAMKALKLNIPTAMCAPVEVDRTSEPRVAIQCGGGVRSLVDVITNEKRNEYLRILKGEHASSDFILNPPFIDESGHSYAYLLSHMGVAPFNSADWIRNHLSFFKSTELRNVLSHYKIEDQSFGTISRLDEREIQWMVEAAPVVLTDDYLMLKNESRLGFSPLSYWIYDIRDVKSKLRSRDNALVTYSPDIFCLERIGNACWTYSSKTVLGYANKYSLAIVAFVSVVFLLLIGLYGRYVVEKNREQIRHKTSLQVLSHEFRTPVSAMLLLLEELSKDMARFNETNQDTVTKISAEVFRLQRIIEMSKTYLQSASRASRFNLTTVSSINSWIEDFAADFDSKIRCDLLQDDQSIEADPFWLRFALANLVQNAFAHGQEPVRIRLSRKAKKIIISVEDGGICEFDSLKEMSEPFVKSKRSPGMGLGLNITSAIVSEWGGELNFRPSPTSFSIAFVQKTKG